MSRFNATKNPAPRPRSKKRLAVISILIDRDSWIRLEKKRIEVGALKKNFYGDVLKWASTRYQSSED